VGLVYKAASTSSTDISHIFVLPYLNISGLIETNPKRDQISFLRNMGAKAIEKLTAPHPLKKITTRAGYYRRG